VGYSSADFNGLQNSTTVPRRAETVAKTNEKSYRASQIVPSDCCSNEVPDMAFSTLRTSTLDTATAGLALNIKQLLKRHAYSVST